MTLTLATVLLTLETLACLACGSYVTACACGGELVGSRRWRPVARGVTAATLTPAHVATVRAACLDGGPTATRRVVLAACDSDDDAARALVAETYNTIIPVAEQEWRASTGGAQ